MLNYSVAELRLMILGNLIQDYLEKAQKILVKVVHTLHI